jgi:hypothetical protein
MVVGDAINIISRLGGAFTSRWAHVIFGITWIGLLWYFNFVQVPSFAEMEAPARNNAIDKLASRALWYFRWAALLTFLSGLSLLLFQTDAKGNSQLFSGDYFKTSPGVSILTGVLFGVTMLLNVWGVIWPNQKKVIANARNVQAGGQPDPDAAAAGRRSALASRMNTIFSFPMLMFMVGTSHFFNSHFKVGQYGSKGNLIGGIASGGDRATYWIIAIVVWAALEANALGLIGGFGQNITNLIYEKQQYALATGIVLVIGYYILFYLVFKV